MVGTDLSRAQRAEQTADAFAVITRLDRWALTHPDEVGLTERRADLRRRVVTLNIGVAESVARRYRNRGLENDDLSQVACVGLVKAVDRFDPAIREDLLTYAVPVIRGELQKHFRDFGWVVRPPRRIQELQVEMHAQWSDLVQQLGRTPGEVDLQTALDATPREVSELLSVDGCFSPSSLDLPVGMDDDRATVGDLFTTDGVHSLSGDLAQAEVRLILAPLIGDLAERDRRVLDLRFIQDRTQSQIGAELGVTQMQVSRILTRILGTLRAGLDEPVRPAA